jgi:hypothetical protein
MAPSNALTVEEITNGFPNPVLPKIDNEPTFEDIQVTTHLLNAAVSSNAFAWMSAAALTCLNLRAVAMPALMVADA